MASSRTTRPARALSLVLLGVTAGCGSSGAELDGDARAVSDAEPPSRIDAASTSGIDAGSAPRIDAGGTPGSASGDCSADAMSAADGPHEYYARLAARDDCVRAYSLRNQAQIDEFRRSRDEPSMVTYDPASDTDPRAQDAAKVVIVGNSLPTQVWLPVPEHRGESLLVTWDAWWGAEFAFENTGIDNYKAFQLCSPGSSIWTEVRARFSLARSEPAYVAMTDVRQYSLGSLIAAGSNAIVGPVVDGRSYGSNSMGPIHEEFGVVGESWTRYWAFFEPQPDGQWYRFSLWVADEARDAVLVLDQLQVRPRIGGPPAVSMDGEWDAFRLEYNTSTSGVPEGRGPLIAYVRNVIMLRGTSHAGIGELLERPVSRAP